jgi:hypothetical protein
MVAGLPMQYWLDLFFHTHPINGGLVRMAWPDGRPYFEQDNILIEVFDLMKDEAMTVMNEKQKKLNG